MKPCRWRYQALDAKTGQPAASAGPYVLATKDLCLYPFIPQLIQAGICSFKIEGRMREGAFLAPLVKAYREAVDRYFEDPQSYQTDETAWVAMQERRVPGFYGRTGLGASWPRLFWVFRGKGTRLSDSSGRSAGHQPGKGRDPSSAGQFCGCR